MICWWLIIHYAGAVHCWPVGEPDDTERDEIIIRARVSVNYPTGNSWAQSDDPGTQVMLTCGEPHPSLLERATVHDITELACIDAAAVDAYRAECKQADRQARIETARRVLAVLPQEELSELLTEYSGY